MVRQDVGDAERWYDKALSGTIRLPGAVSTSNLGDPITGIRQQGKGGRFTDEPVWHPMIRSDYRGNAWYQTTVEVPADWAGQSFDDTARQALSEDKRVVLLPSGFSSPYPTAMTPPFWSPKAPGPTATSPRESRWRSPSPHAFSSWNPRGKFKTAP